MESGLPNNYYSAVVVPIKGFSTLSRMTKVRVKESRHGKWTQQYLLVGIRPQLFKMMCL